MLVTQLIYQVSQIDADDAIGDAGVTVDVGVITCDSNDVLGGASVKQVMLVGNVSDDAGDVTGNADVTEAGDVSGGASSQSSLIQKV